MTPTMPMRRTITLSAVGAVELILSTAFQIASAR